MEKMVEKEIKSIIDLRRIYLTKSADMLVDLDKINVHKDDNDRPKYLVIEIPLDNILLTGDYIDKVMKELVKERFLERTTFCLNLSPNPRINPNIKRLDIFVELQDVDKGRR